MVHASIDIGQRDAGSQRQYRRLVELLRLWRVLRASLAEDERRKPSSHDHASHSASSDAPKVASALGKFNRTSCRAARLLSAYHALRELRRRGRLRLTGAIEAVGVSGAS